MLGDLMRALFVREAKGGFHATMLPRPVPGAGEVLVRVLASGVNPLDTKIRAGMAPHARHPFPAILGMDLTGDVVEAGVDVLDFKAGDRVYGLIGGVAGLPGSLAEYAVVDHRLLALAPRNLSARECAALPLVVITAWEGLVDRAKTGPGDKVLVHGGAGGVGHVAVQLAVALGADVFSTVRSTRADYIQSLGATPIDYEATVVGDYVQSVTAGEGFDVVYDTVGGATLDASFSAARFFGGHVVSCLGWSTHNLAPLSFRAATYSGVFTLLPLLTGKGRARYGQILRAAAKLIEDGKIEPLLDARCFSLDSAMDAHRLLENGQNQGKLVVNVA